MFAIKSGGGDRGSSKVLPTTPAPPPHRPSSGPGISQVHGTQLSRMAEAAAHQIVNNGGPVGHRTPRGYTRSAYGSRQTAAPTIRNFVQHSANPISALTQLMGYAAQGNGLGQMAQPGPGMMWNGSQWVPAPMPTNGFQPTGPSVPGQPPMPNGNNSIAANGGGNGLLRLLMGLA